MSEFEQLIDKDFTELSMPQFKRMLTLIWEHTGPDKDAYLLTTLCKIQAENYKLLKKIEANTKT